MKLGLGTAQFGLDYGVSNRAGRPSEDEVAGVLRLAAEHGIRVLDTAPTYGDSEERIGRGRPAGAPFEIVTKTPLHAEEDSPARCAEAVAATLHRSLEHLGVSAVAGLLEHRPRELLSRRGDAIFQALVHLREQGLTRCIGVSGYEPGELLEIAERYPIDLVQLPVSALDRRALEGGALARLRGHGVAIHARSVFLQGVLLMQPAELPAELAGLRAPLRGFLDAARARGFSPLEAALGYALGLEHVDVVLCGVQSQLELLEILRATARTEEVRRQPGAFDVAGPAPEARWLDPSRWGVAR